MRFRHQGEQTSKQKGKERGTVVVVLEERGGQKKIRNFEGNVTSDNLFLQPHPEHGVPREALKVGSCVALYTETALGEICVAQHPGRLVATLTASPRA